MDIGKVPDDAAELLSSLERRHELVLREIDQLADRIEKTLLEYKIPSAASATEGFVST